MKRVALLLAALALGACEGAEGPMGPSGPQGPQGPVGPQGPAGPGVSYQVYQSNVTSTQMTTGTVQTGGVAPGIVCYLGLTEIPGSWLTLDTNASAGTACAVVQRGSGYSGSVILPSVYVDSGWIARIVLFWSEG